MNWSCRSIMTRQVACCRSFAIRLCRYVLVLAFSQTCLLQTCPLCARKYFYHHESPNSKRPTCCRRSSREETRVAKFPPIIHGIFSIETRRVAYGVQWLLNSFRSLLTILSTFSLGLVSSGTLVHQEGTPKTADKLWTLMSSYVCSASFLFSFIFSNGKD